MKLRLDILLVADRVATGNSQANPVIRSFLIGDVKGA